MGAIIRVAYQVYFNLTTFVLFNYLLNEIKPRFNKDKLKNKIDKYSPFLDSLVVGNGSLKFSFLIMKEQRKKLDETFHRTQPYCVFSEQIPFSYKSCIQDPSGQSFMVGNVKQNFPSILYVMFFMNYFVCKTGQKSPPAR